MTMQPQTAKPDDHRAKESKGPGAWKFFLQWLNDPLSVAACSPSGQQLTRRMIWELPRDAKRVVELGAGTGVFTDALLKQGIEPSNLLVLELNDSFYQHLKTRFPGVRVYRGDACKLKMIANATGFLEEGPADAVISGLGLLSMNRQMQAQILAAAFSVLKPEGRYIQFTYGPRSPVSRELLSELGLSVRRGGFAFWNLPPASVYVFSRDR